MSTTTGRRLTALAAATTLALATVACGSGGDGTATQSGSPSGSPSAPERQWVQTWAAEGEGPPASASAVATSPDGQTVFVGGTGPTIAYAAATGKQLWRTTEPAAAPVTSSLAVSPDGTRVFVTRSAGSRGSAGDYATTAYDSGSGARLWSTTYDGPAGGADDPVAVVALRDLVVVTGSSAGRGTGTDLATVGYDAATGRQRWVTRYDGPGHGDETWFPSGAHALVGNRDGTTVFVAAGSQGTARQPDFATVAYDTATGHQRWVTRYGGPDGRADMASAVAVSPDGSTVVTTGLSEAKKTSTDIATVGYDAASGRQLWVARYDGPASRNDGPAAAAFAPGGDAVFLTGTSEGATPEHEDVVTLAYDPANGTQLWSKRFDGPGGKDDNAADLAVSADGTTVLVAGRSVPAPMQDTYATVAYAASSGARRWTATYGVPGGGTDGDRASEAHAVVTSPTGHTAFVTGTSGRDYATVAYGW